MNYFELYGIPVSFNIDQQHLKNIFYELIGQNDADLDATKQHEYSVSERSSEIKKAFQIFQDQDETIKYVLQLKSLLIEEEKYEPDPQFLMEVMDINEELVELEMDEHREQLMNVEQKATHLMLKIYDDVAQVIENYKEDTYTEEELLQVKDYYHQKKYLKRILDRIKGIRNIASPK